MIVSLLDANFDNFHAFRLTADLGRDKSGAT